MGDPVPVKQLIFRFGVFEHQYTRDRTTRLIDQDNEQYTLVRCADRSDVDPRQLQSMVLASLFNEDLLTVCNRLVAAANGEDDLYEVANFAKEVLDKIENTP